MVQGISDEFYIDHVHPFGSAAASSNAGMIGNTIIDIWQAQGVRPTLKYEDDLKIFRSPSTPTITTSIDYQYDYDREEAIRRIAVLGVPWHKDKGDTEFHYQMTFIGYHWDLVLKRVSLNTEKQLKFYDRVCLFLDSFDGHRCLLRDVEKIHGSLCHVAFVYMEGRSRLPSLSNFAASFKGHELVRRYPTRSMITDLKWWLMELGKPIRYRDLRPRDIQDLGIYVDASTSWGIGIIIQNRWAAFKLQPNWKIEGRDICWLETIAIEFLFYILESMGIREAHLLVHSDNQGAIGALGKGRSPNYHINLSIRRTYNVLVTRFITHELKFIPSEDNLADHISRGDLGSPDLEIQDSFKMPDELKSTFNHER